MSTALVATSGLGDIMQLGDVFKASGYFRDVRDQAQAVVKILYGQELGFSPVVAMMGIHIIEGKPALSSNLLGAMVKRSGKYDYRVKTLTDTECVLEFAQGNKTTGVSSFSIQDAQRAGVIRPSSGWTKYPRNMLFARALSNGVKLYCPDLSVCPIYVPEELGADVNEEGQVTELPKSARPAERTTEDLDLGSPAQSSAEAAPSTSGKGKGQPAAKASTKEAAEVETAASTGSPTVFITKGQQTNFHREFRGHVRPARSVEADALCYEWLKDNGYFDEAGKEPSASGIPASLWPAERERACEWAKAQ